MIAFFVVPVILHVGFLRARIRGSNDIEMVGGCWKRHTGLRTKSRCDGCRSGRASSGQKPPAVVGPYNV